MNLIRKVGQMFGFHARAATNEAATHHATQHAIERARSVGRQADELNSLLRGYLDEPDPFKAFAVDIFEREQESKIHLGDPTLKS